MRPGETHREVDNRKLRAIRSRNAGTGSLALHTKRFRVSPKIFALTPVRGVDAGPWRARRRNYWTVSSRWRYAGTTTSPNDLRIALSGRVQRICANRKNRFTNFRPCRNGLLLTLAVRRSAGESVHGTNREPKGLVESTDLGAPREHRLITCAGRGNEETGKLEDRISGYGKAEIARGFPGGEETNGEAWHTRKVVGSVCNGLENRVRNGLIFRTTNA